MLNQAGFMASGFGLLTNEHLTCTKLVRRTWRERLFSLRPWVKDKPITVPDPRFYFIRGGNSILAHPETMRDLYRTFPPVQGGAYGR